MTSKVFEAIVIGASAGGVEALGQLLQALPGRFPPALLVVLHQTPDRASLLPQLFARKCALPVKEADDKETIVPATVYLAPPDYHLLVEPGKTLALARTEPLHFSRPSIDVLFESAALAYRDRLLGIVLTGASADGAEGLRLVRACGGTAWVQEPGDASVQAMPAAALAQAGADLVLPLAALARKLVELSPDSVPTSS